MATSGIDSATSAAILTAMHGGTAITFAATRLLFCSVMRTVDTGTDTEWTAAGNYVPLTGATGFTWAASAAGAPSTQATASAATISNAPGTTWAGCTEYDGTRRLFWATLGTSKTVNLGDTVSVPTGQLTDSLG